MLSFVPSIPTYSSCSPSAYPLLILLLICILVMHVPYYVLSIDSSAKYCSGQRSKYKIKDRNSNVHHYESTYVHKSLVQALMLAVVLNWG